MFKKLNVIISVLVISAWSSVFPSVGFANEEVFTDVGSSYKYTQAIEFISNEGIVSGYPDGTYKPEKILNRAELLKILIEAKFDSEFEVYANEECFPDVKASEWYTKYVCFAKEMNFVDGYPDGSFKPGNDVNFVEAVKMAMGIFNYSYESTDPWYEGLITIASENNFIPLDISEFGQMFNRGQMADFVTRVLKSENDQLDEYLAELKDYKVTYASLEGKVNVEIEVEAELEIELEDDPESDIEIEDSNESDDDQSSETTIEIDDFAFEPGEITIQKGTTVIFKNDDSVAHTATSDTGIFDSGLLDNGETFSFVFDEIGEYSYHCTPHPSMKGKIIVIE